MNHLHASLPNILTFMWCIWKSRNDNLFGRKAKAPYQMHLMAQEIKNNLEMPDNTHDPSLQIQIQAHDSSLQVLEDQMNGYALQPLASFSQVPFPRLDRLQTDAINTFVQPGNTLKTDLAILGPKVYSDAALKIRKLSEANTRSRTGLGILYDFQEEQCRTKILIQASTLPAPSPLHAEALALILAAKIAAALQLSQPTFLTDNLSLARAAAANLLTDPQVLWEIRNLVAEFKQVSQGLHASIYHIKRDLNGVAHNCS
jgi:hypothetical protein